jgi:hypothetical protein
MTLMPALTVTVAITTLVSVLMRLLRTAPFVIAIIDVLCDCNTAPHNCCCYSKHCRRNPSRKNRSFHVSSEPKSKQTYWK